MKKYFVYDGVADHPLYMDGFRALSVGYIKGAKLMFAAERIGGLVKATVYADETTKGEMVCGTLWEVDDKTYDWLVNNLYKGSDVVEDLTFISTDGTEHKCSTCYLSKGVFAIPDEFGIAGIKNFYKYYKIDESYVDKAIDDCEKAVCDGGAA